MFFCNGGNWKGVIRAEFVLYLSLDRFCMGCHGDRAEASCILPTQILPERESCVRRVIDSERLLEAEERVAELIARIRPNEGSLKRRQDIADYIHSLIEKCFSCQVFFLGSMPLMTYLPDGDIDLTVFSNDETLKNTWATKVYQVMKEDKKNENAEFHVKEVRLIDAEVKVIKCLVAGIVVDITFNQTGGLGSLCFLEEMDHLINQDHLFKRSIILIKAWCYYESRILGANHGLFSTYALETLIIYIFHVFDNSFAGPFEVLYRFLETFSTFDWNNFCVSIWGPIPIHLLPDIAVMPPIKDNGELYHEKFFLKSCSMFYDGLTGGQHSQRRSFVSKYFNIFDPLCMHNNLGRSVYKANFYRICSAFVFGAKKLARLLDFPKEEMISELTKFFMNTWQRNGAGLHTNSSTPSMDHLNPSKSIQVEASYTSTNSSYLKEQNDNISEDPDGEHLSGVGLSFYGVSSQILRIINQHSKDFSRHNGIRMLVCNAKNKEDYSGDIIIKNQEYVEKTFDNAKTVRTIKSHGNLSFNFSNNIEEGDRRLQGQLGMFCSAKKGFRSRLMNMFTISSEESDATVKKSDSHEAFIVSFEHDCRSKSLASRIMSSEAVTSIDDSSCSRQSSSLQATVSNDASHCCHDSTFSTIETSLSKMHSQHSYNKYTAHENHRAPPKAGNYEVPINETARSSDDDYIIATGQVLPRNSQQRAIANSVVVPSTVYCTGPPVPFLELLQTYNSPSHRSYYDSLYGLFDDEKLNFDSTAFNQNVDSGGMFDQQEIHVAAPSIPFLEPSAYPCPSVVPNAYFGTSLLPTGPIRSTLSQGSQFATTTYVLPDAQIRIPDILAFGDGVDKRHGSIRTYPPSPSVVFRDQSPTIKHSWNCNHYGGNLDKGQQNCINRSPQMFYQQNCQNVGSFDLYRSKGISSHLPENCSIGSSSLSHVSSCMTQEKDPSQLSTARSLSS